MALSGSFPSRAAGRTLELEGCKRSKISCAGTYHGDSDLQLERINVSVPHHCEGDIG